MAVSGIRPGWEKRMQTRDWQDPWGRDSARFRVQEVIGSGIAMLAFSLQRLEGEPLTR